jgi:hypothetical protein
MGKRKMHVTALSVVFNSFGADLKLEIPVLLHPTPARPQHTPQPTHANTCADIRPTPCIFIEREADPKLQPHDRKA